MKRQFTEHKELNKHMKKSPTSYWPGTCKLKQDTTFYPQELQKLKWEKKFQEIWERGHFYTLLVEI